MIRVSELSGALLDYWVARAEGINAPIRDGRCTENLPLQRRDVARYTDYTPSTDWAHGGPIIERESISVQVTFDGWQRQFWCATVGGYGFHSGAEPKLSYGMTPLIAAMRAYVANKFGAEFNETAFQDQTNG